MLLKVRQVLSTLDWPRPPAPVIARLATDSLIPSNLACSNPIAASQVLAFVRWQIAFIARQGHRLWPSTQVLVRAARIFDTLRCIWLLYEVQSMNVLSECSRILNNPSAERSNNCVQEHSGQVISKAERCLTHCVDSYWLMIDSHRMSSHGSGDVSRERRNEHRQWARASKGIESKSSRASHRSQREQWG